MTAELYFNLVPRLRMRTSLPLCSLHTKTISLLFTTAPTAQLSALQNLRPNNILMVMSGNLGLLTLLKIYSALRAMINASVSFVHELVQP